MADKLFVDTWGWLNLYDRRESQHQAVLAFFEGFNDGGGITYTTDYVLDETFTLLFKRLPFSQAQQALKILDNAIGAGYLILEYMTPLRFAQTKLLRLKLKDKSHISFTDLTSMIVMEELAISKILTGDAHFTHVGMGFEIIP
jgi:predicted nucleic acid-binding protein